MQTRSMIAMTAFASILLLSSVRMAPAEFRIIGNSAQPNAFGGPRRMPNEFTVFKHWDLREFPDCTIPYSFYNGTADTGAPGTSEFDEIDLGFVAWQAAVPAQVSFMRVLPPPGALCPLRRDGNNMLGWNTFDCGSPGDDSCVAVGGCDCWTAIAANADIIGPGADGWLQTSPNNCCDDRAFILDEDTTDADTLVIVDGGNGRSETPRLGDDVVILGGSVACGGAVVDTIAAGSGVYMVLTRGPNNVWDTQPQSCCDDELYVSGGEPRIRDGGNALVTTRASNDITALDDGTLALTGLFYSVATGRILEADILFNDFYNWCSCPNNNSTTPPTSDIRGTATHEIGHWLGIHHPQWPNVAAPDGADGITPTMFATSEPFDGNNFDRTLENDDVDALNFLYNPDLGDAPDVPYPSLVHGIGFGRVLNGVPLVTIDDGAEHIFGIRPRQARNFTYEWLGTDLTGECESNQVNADADDDGTILSPVPAVAGAGFAVTVRINTAADAYGRSHNYAQRPMYLNIWADWNGNGIFEAGPPEQLAGPGDAIRLPGLYTRGGMVPLGSAPIVWIRTRLDWGEDCGMAGNTDLTLAGPAGAAQFGEVQDTLVPVIVSQQRYYDLGDIDPCNYPTLPDNPAHFLSGCVWLGGCITAEAAPNHFDLDGCDDGVIFNALPWMPCTPVTVTVFVTSPPGSPCYDGTFFFNLWKDGNLDRDFCDVFCDGAAPEWAVVNVPVTPALSPYTFTFMDPGPYPYPPYSLIVRARLTSVPLSPAMGSIGPCDTTCWWMPGTDGVGEVEDYVLSDMQLAVELQVFELEQSGDGVRAVWITASETDNDHFELARDGRRIAVVPSQGNTVSGHRYSVTDPDVAGGVTYTYALEAVDLEGRRSSLAVRTITVELSPEVVTEYRLHQNFPNPFNAVTQIRFDLPESSPVVLAVFNIAGEQVAVLARGTFGQGSHTISFDARGLPSGVYFYTLTAGHHDLTRKLLLLK